jgi:hypothetical protein
MILNIFFSIKLIRQFREGQTIENIAEKHYFSKSRGGGALPPRATVDPPLSTNHSHP